MSKTLGGSVFFYNADSMDYCWREAIKSMQLCCDKVVVLDAGSNDGTAQLAMELQDEKTQIICLPESEWQSQHGKEKLSYFSNLAHSMLDTDWFINVQADEVLHENSYDLIRQIIERDDNEGYLCRRVNLWKDCFHQLNVPIERRPVSDYVIRLAKRGYLSFDDAENLRVLCSTEYADQLNIIHYGFVRKKEVHPKKIRHMLTQVFQIGMDEKANVEIFNPYAYFSDEDLLPFNEHPKIMSEWIKTRP